MTVINFKKSDTGLSGWNSTILVIWFLKSTKLAHKYDTGNLKKFSWKYDTVKEQYRISTILSKSSIVLARYRTSPVSYFPEKLRKKYDTVKKYDTEKSTTLEKYDSEPTRRKISKNYQVFYV